MLSFRHAGPWLLMLGALALGFGLGRYTLPLEAPRASDTRPGSGSQTTSDGTRRPEITERVPAERRTVTDVSASHRSEPLTFEEFNRRVGSLSGGMASAAAMVEKGRWLQSLSVAELESILPEAKEKLAGDMAWLPMRVYWTAIAEKNPQRALELAASLRTDQFQRAGIEIAARTLAGLDPNALLDLADSQTDMKLADAIRMAALPSLAETLPVEAFRLMPGLEAPNRRGLAERLFSAWAKSDRPAAIAATAGIQDPYERQQARTGIAMAWLNESPQAAWSWIASLPNDRPNEVLGIQRSVIQRWCHIDPQAAIAAASGVANIAARENLLENLINAWAPKDPAAAVAWVESVKDQNLRSTLVKTLVDLPNLDPADAFELMLANVPPGESARRAYEQLAQRWAHADPASAAEGAAMLPAGSARDSFVRAVAKDWGDKDPAEAFRWVAALPSSSGKTSALQRLFEQWTWGSPSDAIGAAGKLSGTERIDALKVIAGSWAARDPRAVLAWAASLHDPQELAEARLEAISPLAGNDPVAASQIVLSLPVAERPRALERLVSTWAHQDPAAAAAWFSRIPPDASRDPATRALALALVDADPMTAMQWASTITAQELAAKTVNDLHRRWMKNDPSAARNWQSPSR